jgi:hypothetical protein
MPIFHLKPVAALLDDPAWDSVGSHRSECWANAATEAEARGLASGRYENAGANMPGHSASPSPWRDPRLVEVHLLDAPPFGMKIPENVIVASQM